MYIIVVGGGKVGFYLARQLIDDGHEVLIIEKDPTEVNRISEELGHIAMRGDGCEAATLDNAGTGRADLLISVTGDDEDNLVACQVAKNKFKVPRTIARINIPQNSEIFRRLGIDATVSSTEVIMEHIEHELPQHSLVHLALFRDMGLEVIELRVPDRAPVIGRRAGELRLPAGAILCLVARASDGARIPTPETMIAAKDTLLIVTPPEHEGQIRQLLAGA